MSSRKAAIATILLTLIALIAFAGNSVLCRLALRSALIDPVAFTQIRLVSGAAILLPALFVARQPVWPVERSAFRAALALFLYAIAFSLAYVALPAGTGALILFAMVQTSMIGLSMVRGARPGLWEWAGLALALAGLVYLVMPGLAAPPWQAAALMAMAGIAWGIYSVLGRGEAHPIAATARNFLFTVPPALMLFAVRTPDAPLSPGGIVLAVVSGAITSGLGYIAWYAALPRLPAMGASVVQLAVPAVAATGGILFLDEELTLRLVLASALILGGIFLAIVSARKKARPD